MTNAIDNARNVLKRYDDLFPPQPLGMETHLVTALRDLLDSLEYEYGTVRYVTDGWERGDRFGEGQYIDARSVSDNIRTDRSTITGVRDMSRAVRRIKAGEWEKVS